MANPPHQNDGAELHIRHVPGGKFSQRAADGLAAGQTLEVSLPFGDFFMRDETDTPIVLLASGTGFAPIKSIIEDAIRRRLSREMVLYWGARRLEDLYRIELPRKWAAQHSWFQFVPVLSETDSTPGWDGRTGLVHRAVMEDLATLGEHEVYACGAPAMVHAARQEFIEERGLNRDAFYCDAFVPMAAVDPDASPAAPSVK
jgi:NAD(P)H-flavin reductase